MKNKKLITTLVAATVLTPAFIALGGCGCSKDSLNINARDVYAMAALGSMSFLDTADGGQGGALNAVPVADSRPTTINITNDDVTGVKNCLSMFNGLVAQGGVSHTVELTTEADKADDYVKDYNLKMPISLPNGSGKTTVCTLFFDELIKNVEIDKKDKEIEENTTFNGVIVVGEDINKKYFIVEGYTEVEKERGGVETEIEFKTWRNTNTTGTGALVKDTTNYVVVEQSIENNALEYEYEIHESGQEVVEIELEFEKTKRGIEIEFNLLDTTTHKSKDISFVIRKGDNADSYKVVLTKGKKTDSITVTKTANDSYTFTYSNGYTENV